MSIDPEMEAILDIFFEESFEGLDVLETGLLTLSGDTDPETINTIFRAAHSIKGGAGTFGFMEISGFTHAVETLLDEMRSGSRAVTAEAQQLLLRSVDVIREMIQSAQAHKPIDTSAADALGGELTQVLAQKRAGAPPQSRGVPCRSEGANGWRIEFVPDPSAFKTCNDPIRIFEELANLGSLEIDAHVDQVPTLSELDPSQCCMSFTLTLRSTAEHARVAEVFDWVEANSKIVYQPLHGVGKNADAMSVPASTASPNGALARVEASVSASAHKSNGESGSLRVATEKVDALINLVGELVITQSMLGRFADKYEPQDVELLRHSLAQLTRNTRELQESVMQIRMLPIGFSFNRFPRLVHDLSLKLGKKVDLKLSGEGTELDKTVLEKISDPLNHLVRNALDHGLELPAVRAAAGKSETGTLELAAFHEGGSIIIEVRDDGAGLDQARIVAKARDRGLIDEDANLSEETIHNLIFVAGFSTAEAVSDVSGRGVGMDVVRRNINDLGGHVQIASTRGKGSTIRIRLPLTLAILEGQVLRVGKEIYVASLVSIIETVQSKREDLSCVAGRAELFRHRTDYLPIIRLHELFGIEPDSRDIVDGLLVILEAEGRRVAMFVDELLAQQQVVIKSLETNFRQVPGLAGATIHGDGTVALILDVPGLIEDFLERPNLQAGRAA